MFRICSKYVKRGNLQNRFKILLIGCRFFAAMKIFLILPAADLTNEITFFNSIFSTKISDLTKNVCF